MTTVYIVHTKLAFIGEITLTCPTMAEAEYNRDAAIAQGATSYITTEIK